MEKTGQIIIGTDAHTRAGKSWLKWQALQQDKQSTKKKELSETYIWKMQ